MRAIEHIGLALCLAMWGLIADGVFLWSSASASCSLESVTNTESFVRRLGKDCSENDRRIHAVSADELLKALYNGQNLDLMGVIIEGDLSLDQLPLTPVHLQELPSRVQETLRAHQLTDLRQIAGSLSIRDSVVRGSIMTGVKDGFLLVKRPISMTGTTFERPVDFSRTVFLGSVDFSDTIILREGFFIQAMFDQPARFERTSFGIHTRFHRAVFGSTATFLRAGFNGLAELLEVSFEKETSFSRAYFKMGTGFSGSRFDDNLDFSEALVERDIYFLFTVFERDASFRRATFQGHTDFSDAQFKGVHDFTKAHFKVDPAFKRTQMKGDPPRRSEVRNLRFLYGIGATLAIFMVVFVLVHRKR